MRLLSGAAAVLVLACVSAPLAPVSAPAPAAVPAASAPAPVPAAAPVFTTGLSFAVEPADAEIFIGSEPYGKASALPRGGFVPLRPGLYQISLMHGGYATWRAEVAVRSGIEAIRVDLAELREGPPQR